MFCFVNGALKDNTSKTWCFVEAASKKIILSSSFFVHFHCLVSLKNQFAAELYSPVKCTLWITLQNIVRKHLTFTVFRVEGPD